MTEGDEMALQSQWIDLLRFEQDQRAMEAAEAAVDAQMEMAGK